MWSAWWFQVRVISITCWAFLVRDKILSSQRLPKWFGRGKIRQSPVMMPKIKLPSGTFRSESSCTPSCGPKQSKSWSAHQPVLCEIRQHQPHERTWGLVQEHHFRGDVNSTNGCIWYQSGIWRSPCCCRRVKGTSRNYAPYFWSRWKFSSATQMHWWTWKRFKWYLVSAIRDLLWNTANLFDDFRFELFHSNAELCQSVMWFCDWKGYIPTLFGRGKVWPSPMAMPMTGPPSGINFDSDLYCSISARTTERMTRSSVGALWSLSAPVAGTDLIYWYRNPICGTGDVWVGVDLNNSCIRYQSGMYKNISHICCSTRVKVMSPGCDHCFWSRWKLTSAPQVHWWTWKSFKAYLVSAIRDLSLNTADVTCLMISDSSDFSRIANFFSSWLYFVIKETTKIAQPWQIWTKSRADDGTSIRNVFASVPWGDLSTDRNTISSRRQV